MTGLTILKRGWKANQGQVGPDTSSTPTALPLIFFLVMLPSLVNDPNASKDDFETEKAAEWTTKTADVAAGPDGRVVVDLAADYMISANEVNATLEETQSVLRKIDKRLIAMLVFVYFLQFGDKSVFPALV